MTIVAWALLVVALLANVLAVRALFARDRFTTWMRRCFGAAAFVIGAVAITIFVSIFVMAPALASSPTASDKARQLAERISETINGVAFAFVACALPLIAGFVLHRRAARAKR